jgi:hypothetical protein
LDFTNGQSAFIDWNKPTGEPNTPSRGSQSRNRKSANLTDGQPTKKIVHFGDLPTKKNDTKKPRLQASDIPARLPWNKNIPKIAADFIKLLFVCIYTGDPRYRYDASVDKVQKDEHQRIMTGRPCRRRYPLKQVDTAEKKGVTIYGNCWKCNPNAPAHSTDDCTYGPATGKSASFLGRRYEHAACRYSLGHGLADREVVSDLHNMGWFDGDTTNINTTTEAWDITSQHDTREQEVVHRPTPEVSLPKDTVASPPPVAPPAASSAPHKSAVIHEATRAGAGITILVAALACTDIITDTKTMAMAILIGFGFPALLFFTLVEPAGAVMITTPKPMQALYGTTVSPHVWGTYAHHHGINVAANEVNPMVYLLLVAGALTLGTMLMARQQSNRAPTAAELDAQMSPISDDDEVIIELPPDIETLEDEELNDYYLNGPLRPGFGNCYGPIDYRTWHIGEHNYSPLSPPASPNERARGGEYSPVTDIEDITEERRLLSRTACEEERRDREAREERAAPYV